MSRYFHGSFAAYHGPIGEFLGDYAQLSPNLEGFVKRYDALLCYDLLFQRALKKVTLCP
jgi:hypothetical protein